MIWLNDIYVYYNLPLQQLLLIAKDRYKWKKLLKILSFSPPYDVYVTGLSNEVSN